MLPISLGGTTVDSGTPTVRDAGLLESWVWLSLDKSVETV